MGRSRAEVVTDILSCTRCELSSRMIIPVPFRGPVPARIAIIGEAPGRVENEVGEPFRGPAGHLLDEALLAAGFDLEELAWINPVCCWPEKVKTPQPEHFLACKPHLQAQLELVSPSYLLLVGNSALYAMGVETRITATRGKVWRKEDRVYSATWHPAAVLRDPGKKAEFFSDVLEFHALAHVGEVAEQSKEQYHHEDDPDRIPAPAVTE